MLHFIATRAAHALVVLAIVVVMAFAGVHLIPGDAVMAALGATGNVSDAEAIEAVKRAYGLTGSVPEQFVRWLVRFVQGDWGASVGTGQPVLEMFLQSLPVTLQLFLFATLWSLVIGIPIGILSALRRGSIWDTLFSGLAMIGISVPAFWASIVLIYLLSVVFPLLPPSGYVPFHEDPWLSLQSMLMPSFVLGTHSAGLLARYVRSSLLDNMRQDFIRTARAKGLNERQVVLRHAIKPSMIPVITVIGLSWGSLLAGAFFIEVIFALPGLGRMSVQAIFEKDFPVIQATLVVVSVNVLLVNFLVDLLYAALDPRIRLQAGN